MTDLRQILKREPIPYTININSENVNSEQDLSSLMKLYGTDKSGNWHNYTIIYEKLFENIKNQSIKLFELSNSKNDPNTKLFGSIDAWKQYFKNGIIYGADPNGDDKNNKYKIDQTLDKSIKDVLNKIGNVNIIIDNGIHTFECNKLFFEISINNLEKGGLYIIESICINEIDKWKLFFKDTLYKVQIIDLTNENNKIDNRIILIQK